MKFIRATLLTMAVIACSIPGQARITRLVVEHRESLGADGYERVTGHAYGELDPKNPLNAVITDIQFAPRNARGMVEYSATFSIVKPTDMAKASGVLLYFVPNRGRVTLTGNGFVADTRKAGDILVASGWQGDLAPANNLETLDVPVAKNARRGSLHNRPGARALQRHGSRYDHTADFARRSCRHCGPGKSGHVQGQSHATSFGRRQDGPAAAV